MQPALCSLAELPLARAARRVEFRRIDIGDSDLFALMLEGVAVNDAIGSRSGIAIDNDADSASAAGPVNDVSTLSRRMARADETRPTLQRR